MQVTINEAALYVDIDGPGPAPDVFVAQLLALRHPDVVQGLALVGTGPTGDLSGWRAWASCRHSTEIFRLLVGEGAPRFDVGSSSAGRGTAHSPNNRTGSAPPWSRCRPGSLH